MILHSPRKEITPKRWTRAEYYRLGELGWFTDQRTELIQGEIYLLSPQSSPHYRAVCKVVDALEGVLGEGYWVRCQGPLAVSDDSEPEPDVSVVPGSYDDYEDHPSTALLVVEVSLTSLSDDRRLNSQLYAAAGIAEYWLIDLQHRQLELFRDPVSDGRSASGGAMRIHKSSMPTRRSTHSRSPRSRSRSLKCLP
jgi:Uma2 family endonuclease